MKVTMMHPANDGYWSEFETLAEAKDYFWANAEDAILRFGQENERWASAWVFRGWFEPEVWERGDAYPDYVFEYDADKDVVRVEKV